MTFEKTPRGTYGPKVPSFMVPFIRFMNSLMVRRFRRSGGGRAMGVDALVLTTVGAKTGQQRQSLLGYLPDGDNAWLIVASAGGTAANPAWYHNLAAHPDQATAEIGGKTVNVTADQLAGQERDAAWQRVITAMPRFAGYQKKTDRLLPVIRLTATAGALGGGG
jgi:deazaflavin-dependent oxidoreductase (nitroreductase family)